MSEKSIHNLLPSTQWKPYWSLRDFLVSVYNSGTVTQMLSSCWYFSPQLPLNIFFILLLCCISLHSVTSRYGVDKPMQCVRCLHTTGADMNQNNIERYLNGGIWFCIVFQCWTRTKWDWVFLDVFLAQETDLNSNGWATIQLFSCCFFFKCSTMLLDYFWQFKAFRHDSWDQNRCAWMNSTASDSNVKIWQIEITQCWL